jgi:hypothetical protein
MAQYVIAVSVDFGIAYDFENAQSQLNKELQELLENARFQSFFNGGSISNICATKVASNKENN